jgi:hypothetical protein
MIALILTCVNIALGAVISANAILELNRRDPSDSAQYKVGTIALALGGVGVMLGPLYGYSEPPLFEVLLNIGAAIMVCTWHWRLK